MHMWTAVFSALRRAENAPTKECMPIIFQGCMSAHQSLSRHGFALLRRAVEADPFEFCPLLMEKLEDGRFFSQASIDTMNCSQLVNACRIMMTAPAASTDMIIQALTVIFNLLRSPRLAIVLESVRALAEAPQAWAFKEVLAKLGGPSIPSRIADALVGPIKNLNIRMERFIFVDNTSATLGDDIDGSVHSSPSKGGVTHSPGPHGIANSPMPTASGEKVSVNIGEGDISWGPLCRACVRLGLYMVHRPSDDIEGMSAEEDPQINALLDAIKGMLASLEVIDLRIAANSPIDPATNIPVATISVLPHVKCELLKAYMWLLPENRSGSEKSISMWEELERTIVASLSSLSEPLIEGLISNIMSRLQASKEYSKELVSLSLVISEAAISITRATSAVLACSITQVWSVIGPMAVKWTHASGELLASVLRCIDGSILQNEYGVCLAPHSFCAHDMTAAQILRGLQLHSFWMLGEYIHLWIDEFSLQNAYCFEYVAYNVERVAVTEIMPRLLKGGWIEHGSVQLSALEALYKIAAYAVKLSSESEKKPTFGIISFIRHEMNAILGAYIGADDACNGNGNTPADNDCTLFRNSNIYIILEWVRNVSECQRLVGIGLPEDIGSRPSILRAVGRGQYSDDGMDLGRSLSAYLLALDTMWEAMTAPTEEAPAAIGNVGSSMKISLHVGTDIGAKANNSDTDDRRITSDIYTLPVSDRDQLDLLKLQLACDV